MNNNNVTTYIHISMVPTTIVKHTIRIKIRPTKPNQPTLLMYNPKVYKQATHSDTYLSETTTKHNNVKIQSKNLQTTLIISEPQNQTL